MHSAKNTTALAESRRTGTGTRLRLLLINAIDSTVEVQGRYPPLGLAYLSSSIKKRFGEGAVDVRVMAGDSGQSLAGFTPDCVGISAVSQNYGRALRLAEQYSSRGIPVVLGGVHVSSLPSTIPQSAVCACVGEAEVTFCDVVERVKNGARTHTDFLDIPGTASNLDGEVRMAAARELVADLDTLPFPDRSLLDIRPHTYMFTSRGCPTAACSARHPGTGRRCGCSPPPTCAKRLSICIGTTTSR